MANKPFRFHPEAKEDFRDVIRWYRVRNLIISVEFRKIVSAAIREVTQSPQLWPKYMHGTRRFVIQRFPFSVIYLDDPDELTVIAVAHSKRKPGYWKHRV